MGIGLNYENDMEEWEGDKFTGVGIKRMKAYKCNLAIDKLEALRKHFWKAKLKDKNLFTNWSIIKRALEMDEPRDIHYLQHFNIEPVNGCINKCKDKDGNLYLIPNYCVNDPYYERIIQNNNDNANKNNQYNDNINDDNDFICNNTKKNDNNQIEEKIFKIRFYKYGNDNKLTLEVNNKLSGKGLKEQYKAKENIDYNTKIKMIICGVELKDEEYLYQHNLTEDKPIYVIIING